MKTIQTLLDEAVGLGQDRIIFPIDILQLANEIGEHPDKLQAVEGLIELLAHESNFQRHVALRALRLIGLDAETSRIVGIALSIIASDEAPNVRAEAVRLVGASGEMSHRIRDGLAKAAALDDTDYVRIEATNQFDIST